VSLGDLEFTGDTKGCGFGIRTLPRSTPDTYHAAMNYVERFQLGLVSNCFLQQLGAGESLADLIEKASQFGMDHFELRQTALGDCEDDSLMPNPERLGKLAEANKWSSFNLAIAFPFWDVRRSAADPLFARAREAAQALSPSQPHLRLVDLDSHFRTIDDLNSRVDHVCSLAESMAATGGLLSIENSPYQSWPMLLSLLQACRQQLGNHRQALRLCFDPCNLFPAEAELATGAIRALAGNDLSMLHFKQRNGDGVDVTLCQGAVDWQDQLSGVAEIGYQGLGLFEITPSEDFWSNLKDSVEYLRAIKK